jgi:hypothetical protein
MMTGLNDADEDGVAAVVSTSVNAMDWARPEEKYCTERVL